MKAHTLVFLALLGLNAAADASYIYPAEGQTEEQQQKDEFECYRWAAEETGFDPTIPGSETTSARSSQSTSGGAAKSALGGAAKGAVIAEAADGDAGKGAATGAALGLRRNQRKQKQQAMAQSEAQRQAQEQERLLRAEYDRANAACLEGRGYTVK